MFRQAWQAGFRNLSHIFRNVKPIVYWSPAALYVSTQLFYPIQITGRSMQPTLNPDSSTWRDYAIFDCVSGYFNRRRYRKGDIVAFRSPENPKQRLVKRIVATEGEVVSTLPPYPTPTVQVPWGHVWVQGDEPFHSDDSNLFGSIPASLIEAKLVWIAWPLTRFGPPPKRDITFSNDGAYRHAIATFEKDRTRPARVSFDGVTKY